MTTDALAQRVNALTSALSGAPDDIVAVGHLLEDLLRDRPGVRGTNLQALVRSALPLVDRQVAEALRDVARAHQALAANPVSPGIDTTRFINSATLALRSLAEPHGGVVGSGTEVPPPAAAATATVGPDGRADRRLLFLMLFVTASLVLAAVALMAVLALPDAPERRSVSRGQVMEQDIDDPDDVPTRQPVAASAVSTSASASSAASAPPVAAPVDAEAEPPRPTLRARGEVVLSGTGDAKEVATQLRRALGLPQPDEAGAGTN